MITEADEPLIGKDPEEAKRLALENLRQQWLNDETRGVIQMYEDAARAVGAIQDEIDAAPATSSSARPGAQS